MAVNKLYKIAKKYDMKISTSKKKAIGVCGKNIQWVKIEIEGKIIEQVSNFNYLGSLISCEISSSHGGEYDVQRCLLGYRLLPCKMILDRRFRFYTAVYPRRQL
jgi:hypothetical protein